MRLKIKKYSGAYWKITIDNPPLNLMDPEFVEELAVIIDELENDNEIKIIVFDSANPDYFIAHVDLLRSAEFDLSPRATGLSAWPDIARRFELAPFLVVGSVRGRARAVGSEFVQALDICFASKEKARFAQIEMGCGLIPGGGGLERLPYMVGKKRSMEIIIGADDFDADMAALYGWINRAIPDAELDDFVDRFAKRVASFEKEAIATAKKVIQERLRLAPVDDFKETQKIFFDAISQPQTQTRIKKIIDAGFQQPGQFELELGKLIGEV